MSVPGSNLSASLHWVQGELAQSLQQVRSLVERRIEEPEDQRPLQQAIVELHQVRGTSAMIQCAGIAALADEMKQVLQDVLDNKVEENEGVYAALMGAAVQLADYVDALVTGMQDSVLVFQPTISELRVACGKPPASDAEVFASQGSLAAVPAQLPTQSAGLPAGAAQALAKKYVPVFQQNLLLWIKNTEVQLALGRIGKVSEQIAATTTKIQVHQLFRMTAALAEALLTRGLDDGPELKRLMGRSGMQMKTLAEKGEDAAAASIGTLPFQLLFHIGRSRSQGPRVAALKGAYSLQQLLPSAEQVEELRVKVRGPNTALLSRLSEEIRKDLGMVKDQIDLAVRGGGKAGVDFAPTVEKLNRVGVTLNMLGLGALQEVVQGQAQSLSTLSVESDAAAHPAWLELATALLRVEHSLDDALSRQLRRSRAVGTQADGEDSSPESLIDGVPKVDVQESRQALVRESLADLSKLKTSADAFLKDGFKEQKEEAIRMLTHVEPGLQILGSEHAAKFVVALRLFMATDEFDQVRGEPAKAEKFADVIAGIEYYLEGLRSEAPDTDARVDRLHNYLLELGAITEPAPAAEPVGTEETSDESEQEPAQELEVPGPASPVTEPEAKPDADEVDPEIREIFVDEAEEVLGQMHGHLDILSEKPGDEEALAEARRGFHTLKGSGRMVGAGELAEFAWDFEQLLNKCTEGTLKLSPAMLAAIRDATKLLPKLVEDFKNGKSGDPAMAPLRERAHKLLQGEDSSGEEDLLATFAADARERLAAVQAWVKGQDLAQSQFVLDQNVIGAFHTLRGAAALVEAHGVARLSGWLEDYLQKVREARVPLPAGGLQLVADAATELDTWISTIATEGDSQTDLQGWEARIVELEATLSGELEADIAEVSAADKYAFLAFDQLTAIDERVKQFEAMPGDVMAPGELAQAFEKLQAEATQAGCLPQARVAEALAAAVPDVETPDLDWFKSLRAVVAGMFNQLDSFRDGTLEKGDDVLLQHVRSLLPGAATQEAWDEAAAATPPVDPGMPAVSDVADRVEDEGLQAARVEEPDELPEPEVPEASELADELESEVVGVTPVEDPDELPEPDAPEASELADELESEVVGVTPVEDPDELPEPDAPEASELAEELDSEVVGLTPVEDPDELPEPDAPEASELAEELDSEVVGLTPVEDPDELPEPDAPEASELAEELDSEVVGVTLVEEPDEPESEGVLEIPAAVDDEPPSPADTPADPELLSIFQAEAEELLDSMDQHIITLERDPTASTALKGLARDLHTFKGGARMSGLMSMGTAAHEMESRVEKISDGRIQAGVSAVSQLRTQWEGLQLLHDRLRGGEMLKSAPMDAPEPLAVPEPEIEFEAESASDELDEPEVHVQQAEAEAPREPARTAPEPRVTTKTLESAGWDPQLFWVPEDLQEVHGPRRETARVPVERLDRMLNEAGEISIYRSRVEQQYTGLTFQLSEMGQTLSRVRDQLRSLDTETDAQIAARGFAQNVDDEGHSEFDPLEMDRYTRMQELSRALSESLNDMTSLRSGMEEQLSETETLLMQQGRVNTEVQRGLMGTLMVPFSRQVARLERVVQQTAQEAGKRAVVRFQGVEQELDRNVLERMVAPLEHLLRNSVVHGLEGPQARAAAGKDETGVIQVSLRREGTQLAIEVRDDGRGLDYESIRRTAVDRGLMAPNITLRDSEVAMFIFEAGFSTARELTQTAGRGVGMDVVASEVKQLGGNLQLSSEPGKGASFMIRLPLTLAMSQVLLVSVGGEAYAIPLTTLEGIARLPRTQLDEYLREDGPRYSYGGLDYAVRSLGDLLGAPPRETPPDAKTIPAVLIRLGEGLTGEERRVAVIVDTLLGNREIVSKAVGPQVSAVQGVSGGTILPDGSVVLILDVPALLTNRARRVAVVEAAQESIVAEAPVDERDLVMVVDDSITIRRVTERLLEKNGYRVVTAKDGLDAMGQLQTLNPAVILLDIEMPRADGFEVAAFVRNNERIEHIPIIMITSRSGEKHRERASDLGVNAYVIKPYQEEPLMAEIRTVLDGAKA